ncbi:MAG: 3-oxoacyl-[acyl-carrier protein] reductase [Verrucomicrobiota bacterium]|jgi:NAD(P)-dependent dehydrogenase (short-subunit alcohol dehydrogenase family)
MNLQNKIALITGGTKGIGAAAAMALARDGADIALSARHDDAEARSTADALRALGRRCEFIAADFARPPAAAEVVDETVRRLGAIDILVHSAGGPVNGGLFEITAEQWQAAFDVHVHAIFHLCRAAIPHMKPRGEGAIILISSTAGIRGIVTNIAYQVAKGALPQFTRALAREFANDNIRVNCVAPGVIRTAFHATMSDAQKKLNLEQRIPLHREGAPEHVGSLIAELVKNDYLTGETFTVDGGLTMRIA